jgi:drug/metabolite transporter (DMT)-like permease
VTAVWGWTFVVVKTAISHYPTLPFLGLRFLLALLVMAVVVRRLPARRTLQVGALVGLALSAGYLFQTLGLNYTSPGNAGLLTGLFVVFTPIIERVFGREIPRRTVVAVAGALLGTFALTGADRSLAPLGDVLEILCALAFSVHLVLLSRWSPGLPAAQLALVQLGVAGLIFGVAGAKDAAGGPPPSADVWFAVAVTGILASALAFFIQTWAQANLSASRTALILTTEPAWALFFGVTLAGQRLNLVQALGAALVLVAILGHELAAVRAQRSLAGNESVLSAN